MKKIMLFNENGRSTYTYRMRETSFFNSRFDILGVGSYFGFKRDYSLNLGIDTYEKLKTFEKDLSGKVSNEDIVKFNDLLDKHDSLKKDFLILEEGKKKKIKTKNTYKNKIRRKNKSLLLDDVENKDLYYLRKLPFYGYYFIDSIKNVDLDDDNNFRDDFNFELFFKKLLEGLDNYRIYKLSFRFKSIVINAMGSRIEVFNTSPSFFVYRDMDVDVILIRLKQYCSLYSEKYGFEGNVSLDVFVKEWIKEEDFKFFKDILRHIISSDIEFKGTVIDSGNIVNKESLFKKDLNKLLKSKFLAIETKGLSYGLKLTENDLNRMDLVTIFNIDMERYNKKDLQFFTREFNNKNFILKVDKIQNNKYKVDCLLAINSINNSDYVNYDLVETWLDKTVYEDNNVNVYRSCDDFNIQFNNGNIVNIEMKYISKVLLESYLNVERDDKLGSLDIESYTNNKSESIPYCIAYKTPNLGNQILKYYLSDYDNHEEMFLKFLEGLMVKKNHNLTLYAHNMAGFDGIIILKYLFMTKNRHDLKFKISSNNVGDLIGIELIRKLGNKKIVRVTILDSFLILNSGLDVLSKVFSCKYDKGQFPYSFVNSDNLNYKGKVPDFRYFKENLSLNEYLNYKKDFINNNWDIKNETLNYIEKDVVILYEIIHKYNELIYNKFKVNISRVKTYAGLAFLIFDSNYYKKGKNKNKNIYLIKKKLDTYIREAYFGGVVDVVVNYTDYETYKYDVNSHYPNAMLNIMPGGVPRISTERNINNIFGFVEATVEAPLEKDLKVAILPVKELGKGVLFRGVRKGVWFSEELKMALNYGYKIKTVHSCVQFDKVEGLFNDYVNTLYDLKRRAEDDNNVVLRYIYKLLLNSLYGRMGLRDRDFELKVIGEDYIEEVNNTEKCDVLFKYNDINLVKSSGPIDMDILSIIKKEKLYGKNSDFNENNRWDSTSSTVYLAAAVTAYARMELNKYKNMKNNLYIGGDTDSLILSKPLPPAVVGNGLGQFKLESIIIEGMYLSKKFYLVRTKDGKVIIKCKGINNKKKVLTYNSFIKLFSGRDLILKQTQFRRDLDDLEVHVSTVIKRIKGLDNKEINDIFKKKIKDKIYINLRKRKKFMSRIHRRRWGLAISKRTRGRWGSWHRRARWQRWERWVRGCYSLLRKSHPV